MSTIDTRNAEQIRPPMDVHCGLSARLTNSNGSPKTVTITTSGQYMRDSNFSSSLQNTDTEMRKLTDLHGDGFSLDGSCSLYDSSEEVSEENGKIGVRSVIGGSFTINISSTTEIPAATLSFTSGCTGTVVCNNKTYQMRRTVVVPLNAKTASIVVSSTDPERRVELDSVTPGITLEFDNNNLTLCQLELRSDLKIESPSWEISAIEIQARWPDDISSAISNIGDDVPIWYEAGYDGKDGQTEDLSRRRHFYLSEAASQKNGIITIRGEDSSAKLDKKSYNELFMNNTSANGKKNLYNKFITLITDSGIKRAMIEIQSAPAAGSGNVKDTTIWDASTSRELVQLIINLAHFGTFWPVFVDAGLPNIRWTKPNASAVLGNRNGTTPVWDIYEEDCGSIDLTVNRNIASITVDQGEWYLKSKCSRSKKLITLTVNAEGKPSPKHVKAGQWYKLNPEGKYWEFNVTNARKGKIIRTAESVQWMADKTTIEQKHSKQVLTETYKKYQKKYKKWQKEYKAWKKKSAAYKKKHKAPKKPKKPKVKYKTVHLASTFKNTCKVTGKKVTITNEVKTITAPGGRPGTIMKTDPLVHGHIMDGSNFLFPNYSTLFNRSNVEITFHWKGDPRIQPRDVFRFHRLSGEIEVWTVGSMILKHEAGGTSADITARKGIV